MSKASVTDLLIQATDIIEDEAERLKEDEGFVSKPYQDINGYWTVGYGWCIDKRPLTEAQASNLLSLQVGSTLHVLLEREDIKEILSVYTTPSAEYKEVVGVLVNMAFNLGVGGLCKFKKFLAALNEKNFITAADEMLDSRWAKQVGPRAERLADRIRALAPKFELP